MALNEQQIEYINDNFFSFEQDWKIDCLLFGEPFFENNIIYYDNGQDLSICTYAIPDIKNETIELINSLVNEIRIRNRRSVKIFGNYVDVANISLLSNYSDYYYFCEINHKEYYTNSIIYKSKKDAIRSYKASKKMGYKFKLISRRILSFRHINIIRNYLNDSKYSTIDNSYFALMPHLLNRDDVVLGEVYMNEELIGFSFFHKFSKNKYVQLMSFRVKNPTYKYFDDFVLGEFCENYISDSTLFLGAGNTNNLKQFKSKWGEEGIASNISGRFETMNFNFSDKNSLFRLHLGIWWKELIYHNFGDAQT
jgi:hypothetical protein